MAYAGAVLAPTAVPSQPSFAPMAPPVAWIVPPAPPAYTEVEAARDGRLVDRRAAVLVAGAVGLGGVIQLIALALAHSRSIEPDALIRYDILLTLGLYAAVAVLIVSQITSSVRLRWGTGSLVARIGLGLAAGVGFSLVLLVLVSSATGHLQPDPRIVMMMSEGDAAHITITAFITCLAAPFVEEILFRGLLLESLRHRGRAAAVLGSAGAFAVWHFLPASLVYYLALGAALGGLYLKRGLACSIAAHLGFNSVLTIAAIFVVLGPSHLISSGAISVTAPSGWSIDSGEQVGLPSGDLSLVGPSGAQFDVVAGSINSGLSADAMAAELRSGFNPFPNLVVDRLGVTEVSTGLGEAAEAPIRVDDRSGAAVFMNAAGQTYGVVFLSAGSPKAEADFPKLLASLRVA